MHVDKKRELKIHRLNFSISLMILKNSTLYLSLIKGSENVFFLINDKKALANQIYSWAT
jgi:hypothetical protein